MDIKNKFLATGIGSLPFSSERDATSFVLEEFKDHIPFSTQLPKRSFFESMHIQFTEGFPGARIDLDKKNILVNTTDPSFIEGFEKVFSAINNSHLDYFSISTEYSKGFLEFVNKAAGKNFSYAKSQTIGPFSFGMTVLDEKKIPILLNSELQEIIPQFLGFKAVWQIRQLQKNNCAKKIIMFIDEPYLVAIGSNQFASFKKEDIVSKIDIIVDMIHQEGALAGIHCCGNTDWSICLDTKIDIISFDAFEFLDSLLIYRDSLKSFIQRGGVLAWGIVPNKPDYPLVDYLSKATEIIKRDPFLLTNGALITPSCGCGTLSEDTAREIHLMAIAIAQELCSLKDS